MHLKKATRVLVPATLAAAILMGAAGPASALETERAAAPQAAAAGPIDDLVKGILDAIRGILPAGVALPEITIPEITLPEVGLPDLNIPGLELPSIPGVQIPELPPLTPPALPAPATPVEIVPELPEIVPELPEIVPPSVLPAAGTA
ncbi:hypothetical protein DEJ50_13610 [Streptomyces venezuelae]|uniref:Secreted protein n=1 Tax=Streptomyces venezuelae TaxID=54571 RepID=A0A5P2D3D8_STRVZ|nr:hypothetical protein [Streptomyces venezuelae]QES48707.1 hypothetical protein DEJ50_13610 [Streptomyces venezuelae]